MRPLIAILATIGVSLSSLSAAPANTEAGSPAGFLAEGPLPVIVRRTGLDGSLKDEKGILLLLTKDRLIVQLEPNLRTMIFEAKGKQVRSIKSRDGDLQWNFDAAEGVFVGTVVPVRPIDMSSQPVTPKEESLYLYFSLQRFQIRLEDALKSENESTLKSLQQEADSAAAYIKSKRLDGAVEGLYEKVRPYLEAQKKVAEQRRKVFEEASRRAKKLDQEKHDLEARRATQMMAGFMVGLMGAAGRTDYYRDGYGYVYARQTSDPAAMASGFGTMMSANINYAREKSDLQFAQETFVRDLRDQYVKLNNEYAKNRAAREQALKSVGDRNFRLKITSDSERLEELGQALRQSKDLKPLITLLTDRDQKERARGGRENPYTQIEICQIESVLPHLDDKKHAQEIFARAQSCLKGLRLVPPGKFYDRDRYHILWAIADLVMDAVYLEIGDQSWASAYNPKAAFVVRLLDQAAAYGFVDLGGEVREERAWALILSGRLTEGLQQAVEIQELRKNSPQFFYNLARAYGASKNSKEALRCVEQAVRLGFSDMKALRRHPDLDSLRVLKAFSAATRINAEAEVYFGRRPLFGGSTPVSNVVRVTNRSSFALSNVKLRLELSLPPSTRKQVFSTTAEQLSPNQTFTWNNAFNVELKNQLRGELIIESDQGTFRVSPTAK
jgi:hypothetical protein